MAVHVSGLRIEDVGNSSCMYKNLTYSQPVPMHMRASSSFRSSAVSRRALADATTCQFGCILPYNSPYKHSHVRYTSRPYATSHSLRNLPQTAATTKQHIGKSGHARAYAASTLGVRCATTPFVVPSPRPRPRCPAVHPPTTSDILKHDPAQHDLSTRQFSPAGTAKGVLGRMCSVPTGNSPTM